MEMVRSVLFVGVVGLVSPVDADFLLAKITLDMKNQKYEISGNTHRLVDSASIQSLHSPLSRAGVIKLNKAIVVALTVKLL